MQLVGYLIFSLFAYPLSLLPLPAIYVLADGITFVLRDIMKYRRAVILDNLAKSFPEKSPEEVQKLCREFYSHLGDLLAESVKMLTISRRQLGERWKNEMNATLAKLENENVRIIAIGSHLHNWELAGLSLSDSIDYKPAAVYLQLSNPFFDGLMLRIRRRFGTQMLRMEECFRFLFNDSSKHSMTVFISDQAPPQKGNTLWLDFLHRETAVFLGPEKLARKLNSPVVFLYQERIKRGRYIIHAEILCTNAAELPEGKTTELHVRFLEKLIHKNPSQWLWSHRRWKHKRPVSESHAVKMTD